MPRRTVAAAASEVPHPNGRRGAHWTRDMAVEYAGRAYSRAARAHKQGAAALDISRSRYTRYVNGDDPYNPLAKALEPLAVCEYTTAWSAITEAKVLVTRAEMRDADEPALRGRLMELEYQATQLLADMQRCIYDGDDAERRRVHALQMDLHVECSAILDELDERRERNGGAT